MKRILCLLLVLAFALSVTACATENQGAAESTTNSTVSQSTGETKTTNATTAPAETTTAPTEAAQVEEVSVSERVIYDGEDYRLTLTGYDDSEKRYVKFNFLFENFTKKNTTLSIDNLVINGIYVGGDLLIKAAAEKKANGSLEIRKEDLSFVGIESIATILVPEARFYDSDEYDTLREISFEIKTSIADGYTQKIDESGELLYQGAGVAVKYKGFSIDKYGRPQLLFFLKNDTDKNIIINCENVSVNDYTIYGSMYAYCFAGTVCYEYMDFSSKDLEESKITSVESVSFSLEAYEQNTYDNVFETDTFEIIVEDGVSGEDTKSVESVTESLKSTLSYPNLNVYAEGNNVFVEYWTPGLSDAVGLASSGDESKAKAWNAFVENEKNQCLLAFELFKQAGLQDVTITWSVLNDKSTDSHLLTIVNGEVTHNNAEK